MKLFLIGNSHIRALQRAFDPDMHHDKSVFEDTSVHMLSFGRRETQPIARLVPEGVELIQENMQRRFVPISDRPVIDGQHVWGICQGSHHVVLLKDDYWGGHAPHFMVAADRRPISDALLREIAAAHKAHVRRFFEYLQTAGVPFFCISTPPLPADHPKFDEDGRKPVVRKVDSIVRDEWRAWLAARDIPDVDFPRESLAPDSFLKPEYRQKETDSGEQDQQHANAAYGANLWPHVLDTARQVAATAMSRVS